MQVLDQGNKLLKFEKNTYEADKSLKRMYVDFDSMASMGRASFWLAADERVGGIADPHQRAACDLSFTELP